MSRSSYHSMVLAVVVVTAAAVAALCLEKIETIGGGLADCVCVADDSLVDCRVHVFFISSFFLFHSAHNGLAGRKRYQTINVHMCVCVLRLQYRQIGIASMAHSHTNESVIPCRKR